MNTSRDWLREARQERKLSQQELAILTGLHKSYISALERGLRTPSLKTVHKLSKVLKVDFEKFLD
ncbi:helix-turn-helix transcriptional regulator (plasmid) [Bacillus carboniphilus]|uniref:Helix-turn-helix transcriptional regulator n=1 Tax=Bacillus carboniphilus TaxID=86663 RepID=A0ABY9JYF3_9BACI|nr:helix-turn-helix transcriptional regulator [Bacillus carboniphilus]WLR44426.1 helix-turn-helix transcriptional regulator [Bacillus carboniphilus]